MGAEHSPERPRDEDAEAVEAFRRCEALLYSVIHSMLGDHRETEIVLRETRARWLARRGDRSACSSPGLIRTAAVLALTRLRDARSNGEFHLGPWLPDALREDAELSLAESVSAAMSTVMEALEREQRTVFLLRHGFGFSYADIAVLTGRSEGEVRRIDDQARERMCCGPRPSGRERPGQEP